MTLAEMGSEGSPQLIREHASLMKQIVSSAVTIQRAVREWLQKKHAVAVDASLGPAAEKPLLGENKWGGWEVKYDLFDPEGPKKVCNSDSESDAESEDSLFAEFEACDSDSDESAVSFDENGQERPRVQNPDREYNPLVDMTKQERAELRTMPRVDREVFVSLARAYRRAGFLLKFDAYKQSDLGQNRPKLQKIANDDSRQSHRRRNVTRSLSRPTTAKAVSAEAVSSILEDAQQVLGIHRVGGVVHSLDLGVGLSARGHGGRAVGGAVPSSRSRRALHNGSALRQSTRVLNHSLFMESIGLSPIEGSVADERFRRQATTVRSLHGQGAHPLTDGGGLGLAGGTLGRSTSCRHGPEPIAHRRAADVLASGLLGGKDTTDILVELMTLETEALFEKAFKQSGEPPCQTLASASDPAQLARDSTETCYTSQPKETCASVGPACSGGEGEHKPIGGSFIFAKATPNIKSVKQQSAAAKRAVKHHGASKLGKLPSDRRQMPASTLNMFHLGGIAQMSSSTQSTLDKGFPVAMLSSDSQTGAAAQRSKSYSLPAVIGPPDKPDASDAEHTSSHQQSNTLQMLTASTSQTEGVGVPSKRRGRTSHGEMQTLSLTSGAEDGNGDLLPKSPSEPHLSFPLPVPGGSVGISLPHISSASNLPADPFSDHPDQVLELGWKGGAAGRRRSRLSSAVSRSLPGYSRLNPTAAMADNGLKLPLINRHRPTAVF